MLQLHPVFGTSKGATTLFHKAELLAAATQLAGTGRGGIFKRGDEKTPWGIEV
jgi:hypothetical protein